MPLRPKQTFEAGLMDAASGSAVKTPVLLPPQNSRQRTEDYVRDLAHVKSTPPQIEENMEEAKPLLHTSNIKGKREDEHHNDGYGALPLETKHQVLDQAGQIPHIQHKSPTYLHRNSCQSEYDRTPTTYDLAKCLARNQLITTGRITFDERPENYWAWKSSFQSAIAGLDLTYREEIDLLSKWLGRESSEQVRRIKAAYIRNAQAGLVMAWERLEETYGSPEAIERALFTKLENFPKLTNKEPQKLRELGDLLLELEAAKLDGYLPGLSYLDTSRGVHPIVEKLLYNLQDKWLSFGSKFKRDHKVSFPPFSVFVDFVCTEAKARTDPSFNFTTSTAPSDRRERSDRYNRPSISVHKMTVSPPRKSGGEKKLVDLGKLCPIHEKPHPLRKCRGFREKTRRTQAVSQRKLHLLQMLLIFRPFCKRMQG